MLPHDDLLFARYQGFFERMTVGSAAGRTHETSDDWNEAYDAGMNDAEVFNAWTSCHQQAALQEGWGMFTTDGAVAEPWKNDLLLINRVDEREVFATDQQAMMHVIKMATAGSELHQRALRFHMTIAED
ncbi:hypothetical protein VRRI112168_02700 [Vreelandella rituensis]|uniref:Uncharacterized protein n=1 Tax=Vreelandella rituensis TaxID=2282306 RepID=A0A368UD65_9GAMM|nr:hypothetical protein [Halomonas rituensis]RCV93653.1 hypothetical protein DU506_00420 [Halomonas rituensis]